VFFVSLPACVVIALVPDRWINLPLRRLIGAADRFGTGDLRPVKLGSMPTELDRLGRAVGERGGRPGGGVGGGGRGAQELSGSASDFSAMSEELASSSGEISTAMVRMAASAEQQVNGMREADAL